MHPREPLESAARSRLNPLGPRRAVLADPAMIVAAGAAVRCAMTTAALGGSSSYSDGLRANIADHISERELSASLGFQCAAAAVSVDVPIASHQVSKLALGMGDACPFDSDELIYETRAPLLSAAECAAVRREASARICRSCGTCSGTTTEKKVHPPL